MRRFGYLCLWLLAGSLAAAQSATDLYIERYPGDGIKQRPRAVPPKPIGENLLQSVPPERLQPGTDGTTAGVAETNASPSRAARYAAPRVSSKEHVPGRKPEGRTLIVVKPRRDKTIPPQPPVTTKPGHEGSVAGSTNGIPVQSQPPVPSR